MLSAVGRWHAVGLDWAGVREGGFNTEAWKLERNAGNYGDAVREKQVGQHPSDANALFGPPRCASRGRRRGGSQLQWIRQLVHGATHPAIGAVLWPCRLQTDLLTEPSAPSGR